MQKDQGFDEKVIQGFIKEGLSKRDIIEANMHLIMSCIKAYEKKYLFFDDAMLAAKRGMSKAIDRFWLEKQDFTELAVSEINKSICELIEWDKRNTIISDSYDSLGELCDFLGLLREKNEDLKCKQNGFKSRDKGIESVLFVDHRTNKITAGKIDNVILLPKRKLYALEKKVYENNILYMKKEYGNQN